MQRMEGGSSVREHLIAAANSFVPSVEAQAKLDAEPALPATAGDVWAIFLELHSRRGFNENGPVRWPWTEIQAYLGVRRRRLNDWQLDTIFALEDAYFTWRGQNKQ